MSIQGRGPEQTFFKKRHTDGQQAHEKMFNITNYQGNASQNHNEISPHICQDGHYKKKPKNKNKKTKTKISCEIGRAHV